MVDPVAYRHAFESVSRCLKANTLPVVRSGPLRAYNPLVFKAKEVVFLKQAATKLHVLEQSDIAVMAA